MIDAGAAGLELPAYERSWTSDSAILYALGIGSGCEELQYTTENSHDVPQQVIPTFGVVLAMPEKVLRHIGSFRWNNLVHASQRTEIHRPIEIAGTALVSERVVALWDKGPGRHAIAVVAATARTPSGADIVTSEMTLVIRGEGGFGGAPGERQERLVFPDRDPDFRVSQQTWPGQPLLYRLSGDRNPLHSDPWFARRAGFPRPILHGLSTYGMSARALLPVVCKDDPTVLRSIDARFSSPVLPGEELTTHIWRTGAGAAFRVTASPDDRVVLDDGVLKTVDDAHPDRLPE
jgi:acyl dehydratase